MCVRCSGRELGHRQGFCYLKRCHVVLLLAQKLAVPLITRDLCDLRVAHNVAILCFVHLIMPGIREDDSALLVLQVQLPQLNSTAATPHSGTLHNVL
jgi:hypothetical protein